MAHSVCVRVCARERDEQNKETEGGTQNMYVCAEVHSLYTAHEHTGLMDHNLCVCGRVRACVHVCMCVHCKKLDGF